MSQSGTLNSQVACMFGLLELNLSFSEWTLSLVDSFIHEVA